MSEGPSRMSLFGRLFRSALAGDNWAWGSLARRSRGRLHGVAVVYRADSEVLERYDPSSLPT